ncbi:MAG TPA: superoxide dismutase [Chloroflexota bacterium]|nr:superoxide dismutase [Chloroflexota bacterium]
MAFEVEPLPYDYNALEPYIDEETMHLHHDKHYAAYVNNLNAAIEKHPELGNQSAEDLLRNINQVPEDIRQTVINNGGGAVNHGMFWKIMGPNAGGEPTGAIADVINQNFGGFENFKQQFNAAGAARFGSGWVWLIRSPNGTYEITSTQNQNSPLMEGNFPIFGNDVWEHAYYLKYQNRRPEYLSNWWNVVNWNEINNRLQQANSQG